MVRKFALIVFDKTYKIVDRFNLDSVTDIGGLGYSLKLSTIQTDIEDYVTKIIQTKKNITFKYYSDTGYSGGNSLTAWLEKNINNTVCLEYNDTQKTLYMRGLVVDNNKSELDYFKSLPQVLTFQPLTPFFEKVENEILIKVSSSGKSYPFSYPYSYGLNIVQNNEITNTYIKDIPLIIEITGTIENPAIKLLDENEEVYNEIRFNETTLLENQRIIIDGLEKKIWFDDGSGNLVDYYYKIDGGYDSYLRAKPLTTSKISVNLLSNDTGSLKGTRLQYRL